MIPEYFEFYNPTKILCGHHALENIPYELERLGAKRTLILIKDAAREEGILEMIGGRYHAMIESKLPQPSFSLVDRLAQKAVEGGCDSVLAIGDSDVLNTAKAVRAMLSLGEHSFCQLVGSEWPEQGKRVPFIVVPTGAGNGSECTGVTVFHDKEKKTKQEIINHNFLPDAAVIDSRATENISLKTLAFCGIDALTHAIEAHTGLQKNPLSSAYARSAVRLLGQNLLPAVRHPKEEDYRMAVVCASMMAGAALSNSMAGLVHILAHALETSCGVSYRETTALMLPKVMRWQMDVSGEAYGELLCDFCGTEYYAEIPYRQRGEKLVQAIEDTLTHLHQKCGIALTFAQAGIDDIVLTQAAKIAMDDGALILNAKSVAPEDLRKLFSE